MKPLEVTVLALERALASGGDRGGERNLDVGLRLAVELDEADDYFVTQFGFFQSQESNPRIADL